MRVNDLSKELSLEKEIHLLMANEYSKWHSSTRRKALDEILDGYKVPMLTKIAGKLICERSYYPSFYNYTEHDLNEMIGRILYERKHRLNEGFKWTEENKARFLFINDQLYDACVKGWEEAKETAAALEKRIKQRNSFLKDYEIEITLNIYPKIKGERRWASELESYLGHEETRLLEMNISHSHYKRKFKKENADKPMLIDKSTNWNIEYFDGVFDNDYICYAIHGLLDTDGWSFVDILSINKIWVDVEVKHQCSIKV